jgi:site-specific recombinase XerD
MFAEDYHRAARLSPVIGETLPAGRELLADEIASLIQNCIEDGSPIGIRDAAIISILFGAGLRREEITKLNLEDYNPDGAKFVIRGKRSKQRFAYLGDGALAALMTWLEHRGEDAGPLLRHVSKTVPKESLHLPGPDYVERIYSVSDRPTRTC